MRIRAIHLEDDEADALFVQKTLQSGGIDAEVTITASEEQYLQELEGGKIDLIMVDNGLPGFNGSKALEIAREFMRDFPDMTVIFDKLEPRGDRTTFHWTLTGTHRGTGNHIRISGYELWKINNAGLIAKSSGHFDAADYDRQLKRAPEL